MEGKIAGFRKFNINPKGRLTGDCSTRAIATACGITYGEALKEQYEEAASSCYGFTCKEVLEAVLKRHGFVKMKQPRRPDGRKYRVGEIEQVASGCQLEAGVVISMAHHDTAYLRGEIVDIWDCRFKTIGNYYVKGAAV